MKVRSENTDDVVLIVVDAGHSLLNNSTLTSKLSQLYQGKGHQGNPFRIFQFKPKLLELKGSVLQVEDHRRMMI